MHAIMMIVSVVLMLVHLMIAAMTYGLYAAERRGEFRFKIFGIFIYHIVSILTLIYWLER